MSFEEAMLWGQYRKIHGPFSVNPRIEYGFALLAALQTGEKDLKKFIPWHNEPEVEGTPEVVFTILKSLDKGGRK